MILYDENGQAFEVAGGGDEEEIGAIPNLARASGLSPAAFASARSPSVNTPATRGPAATRLNPAVLRNAMAMPRMGVNPAAAALMSAGISEARARQIVREELGNLPALQQIPPNQNRSGVCQNPMGVGYLAFTSATPTTLGLQAKPQRGFRGERLVIDIRRSGPSAEASPVIITKLTVGDYNQLVGGGPLPADIFANNSVGVRLDLDASYPGVLIDIEFQVPTALAVGDSIFVSVGIIGSTVDITAA